MKLLRFGCIGLEFGRRLGFNGCLCSAHNGGFGCLIGRNQFIGCGGGSRKLIFVRKDARAHHRFSACFTRFFDFFSGNSWCVSLGSLFSISCFFSTLRVFFFLQLASATLFCQGIFLQAQLLSVAIGLVFTANQVSVFCFSGLCFSG